MSDNPHGTGGGAMSKATMARDTAEGERRKPDAHALLAARHSPGVVRDSAGRASAGAHHRAGRICHDDAAERSCAAAESVEIAERAAALDWLSAHPDLPDPTECGVGGRETLFD